MKNLINKTFAIALLSTALFTSCKKYEEGPVISLMPKKERVANTWKIEKALEDDKDVTSSYEQYELQMLNDGKATLVAIYTSGNFSAEFKTVGTWNFENSKEDLKLDFENNDADNTYQILKLKENELWLREKGKNLELHLEPK